MLQQSTSEVAAIVSEEAGNCTGHTFNKIINQLNKDSNERLDIICSFCSVKIQLKKAYRYIT